MRKKITIVISMIIMIVLIIQPVYASHIVKSNVLSETEITEFSLGYYDIPGFSYDDTVNGLLNRTGFGIDYLKELSVNSDFKPFFVKTNRKALLSGLNEGEYDVIFSLRDYEKEDSGYIYTKNSIVEEHCVIYVNRDADICYEEYDKLDNIYIGMLGDSYYEAELKKYAEENGFSYNVIYYNTGEELQSALLEERIDAILVGSLEKTDSCYKAVAAFGVLECCLMAKKENKVLIEQLDVAIEYLKYANPHFLSDLKLEHYWESSFYYPSLTRAEQDFVEEYGTVKVGYLSDMYPLTCIDENGKFSGISRQVLEYCSRYVGIDFEYYAYDDFDSYCEALANKEIDMLAIVPNDMVWAETVKILTSDIYLTIPMYEISNNSTKTERVAMIADFSYSDSLAEYSKQYTVIGYDSAKDCLNAVKTNTVGKAALNKYTWMSYSNKADYAFFESKKIEGITANYSFAVSDIDNNERLISIISKTVRLMPDVFIEKTVTDEILASADRGSLTERMIATYKYHIIVVIVILLAVFISMFAVNRRKKEDMIKALAYTDTVTGRNNFTKFIEEAKEKLTYRTGKYAICVVNISNFKYINDYYGREQGDNILKAMSQLLEDVTLPNGIFARQSADKFVFMVDYIDYPSLEYKLDTYISDVEMSIAGFSDTINIKCNCGVYLLLDEDTDIHDMIDKATLAEKKARDNFYKSIVVYDNSINELFEKNQRLTAAMKKALENEEFVVYLQPKIDMFTGNPISCEALVRWISPTMGFIPPNDFISLFEKNGFVTEVDFYVLRRVCMYLRERMNAGMPVFPISVNQSRIHINNPMYFSRLQSTLNEFDIPMNLIIFEITESAFMENPGEMIQAINKMKKMGFVLSIDDFGSGYSSFNLLKDMPVDELKIDRGFLETKDGSNRNEFIVEKIVQMAHGLKAKVVCEGVETEDQVNFLKGVYCDVAQGYFYSKPMPIEQYNDYLKQFNL